MGEAYSDNLCFPCSQRTAKTNRLTFAFAKRCLKFPIGRWLLLLFATTIVVHAHQSVMRAQGRIIAMEKNLDPVRATTEVTLTVGTTRNTAPIDRIPKIVAMGDELIGITGQVKVKVRCNNSSVISLSGKFQVRFLRPRENGDCNLSYRRNGRSSIDVNAGGPTSIQTGKSGEIRMGTRGTRYVVSFSSDQGEPAAAPFEMLVFEGQVTFASPSLSATVKGGQKVEERDSTARIKELGDGDVKAPAEVQAGLDVSQATNVKNRDAAFRKLLSSHIKYLKLPNSATLMALFETQQQLGVPSTQLGSLALKEPLKPGEVKLLNFNLTGGDCKSAIKVWLTLIDAPFARLLSSSEAVVTPDKPAHWEIQLSAIGLAPGSYEGQAKVTCANCSSQRCFLNPMPRSLILDVQ